MGRRAPALRPLHSAGQPKSNQIIPVIDASIVVKILDIRAHRSILPIADLPNSL
ncbi:BgTH12-03733 [Blumeria graminis f. sp. triticale]|uniref:BgTH12-03733 n=1 Tax=Blumeria graminis f. sp. triticale TaxID=1689686 RepID=A0A9W4CVP7_BLUGR|nr:BgTH12-03733 [Blumeria graminis f. sp. triticale]